MWLWFVCIERFVWLAACFPSAGAWPLLPPFPPPGRNLLPPCPLPFIELPPYVTINVLTHRVCVNEFPYRLCNKLFCLLQSCQVSSSSYLFHFAKLRHVQFVICTLLFHKLCR